MPIKKTNIYGWKGLSLSSRGLSLGIIPDVGGRIISLKYKGEELFYVDKDLMGLVFDLGCIDFIALKKKLGFLLWGGDKTWVAPEKEWQLNIPPLDLDAGKYEATVGQGKIILTSPICRETGLRIIREVSLEHDGKVFLNQVFVNCSEQPITKGIWNVTQVLKPCDCFLAAAQKDVRSYHLEDKSLPSNEIIPVYSRGWSKIPCRDNTLFKFGAKSNVGLVAVSRKSKFGYACLIKSFPVFPAREYPHDSTVEVFNSDCHNYFEIETHSPLITIPAGKSISHSQKWEIKDFYSKNELLKFIYGKNN
ncbi:MAG: hypothetical protein HQL27_08760 [Candidatus Omnitrophica bacterium]|nr:hypothetical protein [Candidatus Omnitrophota bacterium]